MLGAGPSGELRARKVVVTAGPTHEPVDDVRFLGNRSSGKDGRGAGGAAAARGARGDADRGAGTPAVPGVQRVEFETAAELAAALTAAVAEADVVVMAAAVADFRPAARAAGQALAPGRRAGPHAGAGPRSAGRAGPGAPGRTALPDRLRRRDRRRGRAGRPGRGQAWEKGCDAIVANDVSAPGIGFDADENAVTVLFAGGEQIELPRASKRAIADRLWGLFAGRLGPAPAGEAAHA